MKLKNYFLLLTCLFNSYIYACHETSVTETSVTDNGNGTYTYVLQICMGSEDTYGFELDFNGANIITVDTPCITSSTTGETICAITPSISGTGDVEYGDFDNTLLNPFNSFGDGQLCVTIQITLDDPAADVDLFGTEESVGFCGDNGDLTSCFGQLQENSLVSDASDGCSSDGSIASTASNGFSPYSYSWDNGDSGSSISGLAPGDYTVTVTDAEGCTETGTYTVSSPAPPDYTIDLTTPNCIGGNVTWEIEDPSANIIASGSLAQNGLTQSFTACGCGAALNLTVPAGASGNPSDRCDNDLAPAGQIEVFDASGVSLGTATADGASITLDCGILPVSLLSSNAKYLENMNQNIINWTTASEKNNDYFTIYNSVDGKNWRVLGQVLGSGTVSKEVVYSFVHSNFKANSVNYYRISQTDFDGTTKVISTLSVDNRSSKKLIKIVNSMGQEVSESYSGIVIKYFEDGSVEKVYL